MPVLVRSHSKWPRSRRHTRGVDAVTRHRDRQRRPGPRPRQQICVQGMILEDNGAQRRPGPRPRQQSRPLGGGRQNDQRSTKAGAETPATARRSLVHPCGQFGHAQRRPGPRPRQQLLVGCDGGALLLPLNEGRGRDPGNRHRTATRWRSVGTLNEGRGRDPGNRPRTSTWPPRPTALNEGRGRDPGNRASTDVHAMPLSDRSTKAGAETPATDPAGSGSKSRLTSAQRRPGPRPRQQIQPGADRSRG